MRIWCKLSRPLPEEHAVLIRAEVDSGALLVRYLLPFAQSEDAMRPSEIPVKDRRIQKTRDLLHRSLAALIHEKPYDSISVKEILDRANVGRSTFYTHFSDKDELLVSSIHDLLRSIQTAKPPSSAKRSERIISFSLPIFEHIDHHRHTGDARMGAKVALYFMIIFEGRSPN